MCCCSRRKGVAKWVGFVDENADRCVDQWTVQLLSQALRLFGAFMKIEVSGRFLTIFGGELTSRLIDLGGGATVFSDGLSCVMAVGSLVQTTGCCGGDGALAAGGELAAAGEFAAGVRLAGTPDGAFAGGDDRLAASVMIGDDAKS